MVRNRRRKPVILAVLALGGCLFSGPCGLTTLQMQDFLTSTVIRTSVTTLASIFEAAAVQSATEDE